MINTRISWDEYYMRMAHMIAQRSTCARAQVGSLIIKNKLIVSQGYNGSIIGAPHCDDVGHLLVDDKCVRVAHAEANSIVNAAARGVEVADGTLFVTHFPCWNCIKLIANAHITEVIYDIDYRYRQEVDELVGINSLPISFRKYSIIKG